MRVESVQTMQDKSYIEYLESVVLSLLAERKAEGEVPQIGTRYTFSVCNIKSAIDEHRTKRCRKNIPIDGKTWAKLMECQQPGIHTVRCAGGIYATCETEEALDWLMKAMER